MTKKKCKGFPIFPVYTWVYHRLALILTYRSHRHSRGCIARIATAGVASLASPQQGLHRSHRHSRGCMTYSPSSTSTKNSILNLTYSPALTFVDKGTHRISLLMIPASIRSSSIRRRRSASICSSSILRRRSATTHSTSIRQRRSASNRSYSIR